MRGSVAVSLIFCLANALAPLSVHAGVRTNKSLDEIRIDIRALEAVESNPETLPEVAVVNRGLLRGKRQELLALLGHRKAAFENYIRTVGASLDQREAQKVQTYITEIQGEMRRLEVLVSNSTVDGSEAIIDATDGTAPPQASRGGPQLQPLAPARYLPANGVTRTIPTSDNLTAAKTVASALPTLPTQAVDSSCPSCTPDDRPDVSKDFIINVRTGETSGRKKFRLRDNARIIIIEKNPFLYEYKVTLKDKAIVESAIAEFWSYFPLFAETLKPEAAGGGGQGAAPSCPQIAQLFPLELNTASALLQSLQRDDSSVEGANSLRNNYTAEEKAYKRLAKQLDAAKKVLYDPNASCTNVCATATSIRASLQQYDPELQQLSNDVNLFKSRADSFQRQVKDLDAKMRGTNPSLPNNCFDLIDEYRNLASAFMETAKTLEDGIKQITTGKKTFDTVVKTVNSVFSSPNAFYQVYTRGEYSLPTDVEITVERKDLSKEDATFAKVVEGQTINFGGGARFAIAGGIVVSPLETINFVRVPAVINGQLATVVGKDEGSNTRILPMLMLHGRLTGGDWRGMVSGIHMSLGITAKPNDTGTNVEFLIGPSISFIEERLFLTFGGYAGRRKQLEGNFVEGQEIPAAFTDEIPTSNHLVWKPGVALTYKFK